MSCGKRPCRRRRRASRRVLVAGARFFGVAALIATALAGCATAPAPPPRSTIVESRTERGVETMEAGPAGDDRARRLRQRRRTGRARRAADRLLLRRRRRVPRAPLPAPARRRQRLRRLLRRRRRLHRLVGRVPLRPDPALLRPLAE